MYRIYGCYNANVGGKEVKVLSYIASADRYTDALEIIDACKDYSMFEIKED